MLFSQKPHTPLEVLIENLKTAITEVDKDETLNLEEKKKSIKQLVFLFICSLNKNEWRLLEKQYKDIKKFLENTAADDRKDGLSVLHATTYDECKKLLKPVTDFPTDNQNTFFNNIFDNIFKQ